MYSEWVDACKSSVLQSTEWKRVSAELHTILSDKLCRDRVGFFADLSSEEQLGYIKQIRRYDLKDTAIYSNFKDKLEEMIEQYISMEVDKVENASNPDPLWTKMSRLDKILQITSEGTAKLLNHFPPKEIHAELSGLSNMSMSPNLRKEVWKILLFNNDHEISKHSRGGGGGGGIRSDGDRTDHIGSDESTIDSARSSTGTLSIEASSMMRAKSMSSMNTFRITEQCENILLRLSQTIGVPDHNPSDHAPGFGDLNTLLPLMKGVMIDYHSEIGFFKNEQSTLCEERYFHFVIPILVAITDFLSESITTKIRQYPVFQRKATKWFRRLIGNQDQKGQIADNLNLDKIQFGTDLFSRYYLEVKDLILKRSPDLLDALQRVAVAERLIEGVEDQNGDQDDDGNFEWIRVIVEPLMSEMVEYWFVNMVNIETALHLWDQLLLKRFETLPLIICSLLNVISVHLRDCHNVDGFTSVATRFLPTVHHTRWLEEMQRLKYSKSNSFSTLLTRIRSKPHHEVDDNTPKKDDSKESTQQVTLDASISIDMLQPLSLRSLQDHDASRQQISAQNRKLIAGMLMVGKLQRIRESASQTQSMSQSPMKTPRKVMEPNHEEMKTNDVGMEVVEESVDEELNENEIDEMEEEEEDTEDDVDIDDERDGHGQKVMTLVIEEAVVQVLRGIRDLAALGNGSE